MKYLLLLALACALPAQAVTTVTATPGPWDLYKGSSKLASFPTTDACIAAAAARASLLVPGSYTYSCKTTTKLLAKVVADPPPPPVLPLTIAVQPVSVAVTEGAPASFGVAVTGEQPITYRWHKDGVALQPDLGAFQTYEGITAPQLTVHEARASEAGRYKVVAANPAGSVTSAEATLTIKAPVQPVAITVQPLSVTVVEGAPISLSTSATGAPPLQYQWFKDGIPVGLGGGLIPAGPTYGLTAAQLGDAGVYTVTVRNAAGSATSTPAVVTVTPKPNGSATLSWLAPVWKANGTDPADVAGYVIRYGQRSGAYSASQAAASMPALVAGLAPGTWFFAVAALDSAGNESALGFEVSKVIPQE